MHYMRDVISLLNPICVAYINIYVQTQYTLLYIRWQYTTTASSQTRNATTVGRRADVVII